MFEVIKAESPIFASLERACWRCEKKITVYATEVICKCGAASYCSLKCQKADLLEHKAFCNTKKKVTSSERTTILKKVKSSSQITHKTTLRMALIRQFRAIDANVLYYMRKSPILTDLHKLESINRKKEFQRLSGRRSSLLVAVYKKGGMIPMLLTSEKLREYIQPIADQLERIAKCRSAYYDPHLTIPSSLPGQFAEV